MMIQVRISIRKKNNEIIYNCEDCSRKDTGDEVEMKLIVTQIRLENQAKTN